MDKGILSPAEILPVAISTGKAKAEKSISSLIILGLLAGAFIAFAAEGSSMAGFNLLSNPETYGLGRCLVGAVFSTGLMMVVITGTELFTGNTLISVAVMEKKTTIGKMLKNWVVVYLANLVGSILIAYLVAQTGLLSSGDGMLGATTVRIAVGKVNLSFMGALCSGILCNWLVCLAVWMAYAAKTMIGKLTAIFFPIWLFATSGFEHSVANMYYIPAGIMAKAQYGAPFTAEQLDSLNWGNFFTVNLLPVTIGNIIGGVVFVGMAYWFTFHKKNEIKNAG